MGLDISIYRHRKDTENNNRTFRDHIGYFRKVNFLMEWAGKKRGSELSDEDNCRDVYLGEKDALEELRCTCNKVLEDHDKAPELLPTMDGFFFGSINYGDAYFEDVQEVKTWLEEQIALAQVGDEFFLNAWW